VPYKIIAFQPIKELRDGHKQQAIKKATGSTLSALVKIARARHITNFDLAGHCALRSIKAN